MRSDGAGAKRAGREPPRRVSGARVLPGLVVGAALLAFAAGALVFGSLASDGSGHVAHGSAAAKATVLGGLTLQVELDEWVNHNMLGGPAPRNAGPFKMPMTGIGNMPAEGNDRFHLEVLIANQGNAPQALSEDEFRLRTSDGRLWSPNPRSDQDNRSRKEGGGTRYSLVPGQMTDVDLFFDVPENSREPLLVWSRAGEQVSIEMGAGATPQHQH
jgi:hypothetical protein